MLAVSRSTLSRKIGITTSMYRNTPVRVIIPALIMIPMAMMVHAIIRSNTVNRVEIPMKTIKVDAMTATTSGVAMTSTEVSVIAEMMTAKNRIGVIEKINAAMLQ